MGFFNDRKALTLLIGDAILLVFALWVSLSIRFQTFVDVTLFEIHFYAFLPIFFIWIICFLIAGLYETHRVIIRNRLPEILLKTQIVNVLIAIGYFYLFASDITPKVILSILGAVSFGLIVSWRIFALFRFLSQKKQKAIMIAAGEEAENLFAEVNRISYYNFEFTTRVAPSSLMNEAFQHEFLERLTKENVEIVVVDSRSKDLEVISSKFLNTLFSKLHFFDFYKLYGEVFYRLPIDLLSYRWFIEHIHISKRGVYDVLKRVMDVVIALPLMVVFMPFVVFGALLLKIQDRGEVFSIQTRIGRFNRPIKLIKLRTMLFNDHGKWETKGKENKVTKVGAFLRKTRIDELPQIINVLKGDVSLIGPRPEFPDAVNEYAQAIPYYNMRHLIQPGLSGWAQIYHDEHPHHNDPEKVRKTRDKLSYDLYYVKNRSIILDIMIALKTIKTLLSREGK